MIRAVPKNCFRSITHLDCLFPPKCVVLLATISTAGRTMMILLERPLIGTTAVLFVMQIATAIALRMGILNACCILSRQ
jgi:hypothetical protein